MRLGAADSSFLSQDLANYQADYSNAAATDDTTLDGIAQNYLTLMQQQLSAGGWQAFTGYLQTAKTNIKIWGTPRNSILTSFTSSTALYLDTGGSEWSFFGSVQGGGGLGQCPSASTIDSIYNGVTMYGTPTKTGASITRLVANGSTSPPTETSQPGAGQLYTVETDFYNTVYVYEFGECVPDDPIEVSTTTQYEIAYTKLLETGIAYGCDGKTCNYPVSLWCQVPNPDYKPTYVKDTAFWGAWYGEGVCSRFVTTGSTHTPWVCLLGLAVGTTNLLRATACTYNP